MMQTLLIAGVRRVKNSTAAPLLGRGDLQNQRLSENISGVLSAFRDATPLGLVGSRG